MNTEMNIHQLILAIVMTNAGGDGKSTFAEILAALARLAGLDVAVADIDAGNRGYLNRNGDGSAASLDWSPKSELDVLAPADPSEWYDRHLAGKRLAILDTGANMLAAANTINSFLAGLMSVAHSRGARIIVYGVTSPNKPGSADLIEMMYQRFHRGAEVVVVKNDRDGSKSFKRMLEAGTPTVELPHFAPGLQEVRLRRCLPLHEVLTRPETNYQRATSMIAQKLLTVAQQESVINVIGDGAIAPLEQLAVPAPKGTFYTIANLKLASDAAITANENIAAAWHAFHDSDEGSIAFTSASALLWRAERKWSAITRR